MNTYFRSKRLSSVLLTAVFLSFFSLGNLKAKEKVSYAYLADPALEGVMYAIKNGIVKSDKISIETSALQIPALISSTPAKKYQVNFASQKILKYYTVMRHLQKLQNME